MKTMETRRFNRHANMNSEVRSEILQIICELASLAISTKSTENMLYGFFDGYDSTEKIIFSNELAVITHANPELAAKISTVCGLIEKYPTEYC